MPPEPILEALRSRPFQAFRIFLTDGATFDIKHPEMVLVLRGAAIITTSRVSSTLLLVQDYQSILLNHITRLEPIDAPTESGHPATAAWGGQKGKT